MKVNYWIIWIFVTMRHMFMLQRNCLLFVKWGILVNLFHDFCRFFATFDESYPGTPCNNNSSHYTKIPITKDWDFFFDWILWTFSGPSHPYNQGLNVELICLTIITNPNLHSTDELLDLRLWIATQAKNTALCIGMCVPN